MWFEMAKKASLCIEHKIEWQCKYMHGGVPREENTGTTCKDIEGRVRS